MSGAIEWTIILTLGAGALYLGLPALAKTALRRRFLARVRRSGCACLTFDDGPDPAVTLQIAEALQRAGARGTFFMIGERARRHRRIAAALAAMGHEIGEHGLAHRNALKSAPWTSVRELWGGGRALAAVCPADPPRSLRPPYGKMNLITLLYVWLRRRRLAFWDVDPRDYAQSAPAEVARHVVERLGRGRVVLLHDGRMRPGSDPRVTLEAVRLILENAAARDVPLVTVSEAIARGGSGRGGYDD